jgi:hypothetical protein
MVAKKSFANLQQSRSDQQPDRIGARVTDIMTKFVTNVPQKALFFPP